MFTYDPADLDTPGAFWKAETDTRVTLEQRIASLERSARQMLSAIELEKTHLEAIDADPLSTGVQQANAYFWLERYEISYEATQLALARLQDQSRNNQAMIDPVYKGEDGHFYIDHMDLDCDEDDC